MSKKDWKQDVFYLSLLMELKKDGLISSKIDFKKMLKSAQLENRKGIIERTIDDLNERISNWKECIINDTERLEKEEKELEEIIKQSEGA